MLPFAYYLVKVIICSAILFGYYWFFLRNKIFHSYNRFYLLSVIVLSLALPLLKFNVWQEAATPKTNVIQMLQVVNNGDEYMDGIIIQSHYNHVSKEEIAWWAFITISLLFAGAFLKAIFQIYSLKKSNPGQQYDGINLIRTMDKRTPFSFLKNIFWNEEININSKNGKRILKHEVAHVQERHSHDKLFINTMLIFFWCNPVFWLIRKELNMIHEFIADKKAVEDGDTAAFAAMIMQASYPGQHFELANHFFYSPIKRRLSMLTKNKTKVNYVSRLFVLPLVVTVFAAFTIKAKTYMPSLPKDKTITVVIDAGHGGTDDGATGLDGSHEKDLNLALAKKISELNKDENIRIILTREADVYNAVSEKAIFTNSMHPDLFISIHINASPQKEASGSGMEIYIAKDNYPNSEKSRTFASAIIHSFQNNFSLPLPAGPQQKGIRVLQEPKCPAVLIEAGYMSNKKDLAYLQSADGKEQFAKNILKAIISFANNEQNKKINSLTASAPSAIKASEEESPAALKDTNPTYKPIVVRMQKNSHADSSHAGPAIMKAADFTSLLKLKNVGPDPLVILNGKESTLKKLYNIDPNELQDVRVLQPETAMLVYGEKARQGVLIVNTKTTSYRTIHNSDIENSNFTVGNMTSSLANVKEFRNQKTVSVPGGYTFISATVYFSGNGFEHLAAADLTKNDLTLIQGPMDRCTEGTMVTFDDIKVQDEKGNILFISARSYTLTGG